MPDATTFPVIHFDGQHYEVKYRNRDLVAMKKLHQIDMLSKTEIKGADILDRTSVLISYGIAHIRQIAPEEVCDLLQTTNVLESFNACQDAVSKVVAQLLPALAVPEKLKLKQTPIQ